MLTNLVFVFICVRASSAFVRTSAFLQPVVRGQVYIFEISPPLTFTDDWYSIVDDVMRNSAHRYTFTDDWNSIVYDVMRNSAHESQTKDSPDKSSPAICRGWAKEGCCAYNKHLWRQIIVKHPL